MILKLNSKGNIEWNKVYNNNNMDILEKIEQTEDGGYIVCGYTQSNDNFDTLILKLDENGNF